MDSLRATLSPPLPSWTASNDPCGTATCGASGQAPCSWLGVACQDWAVVSLNLGQGGLRGTLPAGLAGATSLTSIYLPSNQLSEFNGRCSVRCVLVCSFLSLACICEKFSTLPAGTGVGHKPPLDSPTLLLAGLQAAPYRRSGRPFASCRCCRLMGTT